MKTIYLTLILFAISLTSLAQGIAVQGIARDNTNAAISDTNMTFTFSITKDDNTVLFSETQSIRTDNFGVFSHIVSTGNPSVATFNDIDFSIQGLKIKVSVNYNSNNIEVYNQALQYTPYAHYAKKATYADSANNGVPPGTIVAFLGEDSKIPSGWVKCIGQNISSGDEYEALREVIGNTIPDLRGRFLKGQGISSNIPNTKYDEFNSVRDYQEQSVAKHTHSVDLTTSSNGNHNHTLNLDKDNISTSGGGTQAYSHVVAQDNSYGITVRSTTTNGAHTHRVTGNTGDLTSSTAITGEENRPWTVIVNYIIKL